MAAEISPELAKQLGTDPDDPWGIKGFDCSRIHEEGIDKQMSLRAGAIMDYCSGRTSPASAPHAPSPIEKLLSPFARPMSTTWPASRIPEAGANTNASVRL